MCAYEWNGGRVEEGQEDLICIYYSLNMFISQQDAVCAPAVEEGTHSEVQTLTDPSNLLTNLYPSDSGLASAF